MYGFMSQDDPVQNLSPFNIASLFNRDEGRQKGFDAIGYDFDNDFIKHIAKGNGP